MLNISVGHPNGELGISEGMEEYIGRLDFPYVTGMHEILLQNEAISIFLTFGPLNNLPFSIQSLLDGL